MMTHKILLSILLSATGILSAAEETPSANYLWYRQPAGIKAATLPWQPNHAPDGKLFHNLPAKPAKDHWESQTLPVGNGRIGGTIFGGDHIDRVNLNEVSFWSGGPNLPGNGIGYKYGPLSGKDEFGSYQPFGNLYVEFNLPDAKSENYTRSLDLRDGIARVKFTNGGVTHSRECFVSAPDQVLVYTATADKPNSLSARIALLPYHTASLSAGDNSITMFGTLNNGQQFEGKLQVRVKGGSISKHGKGGVMNVSYTGKHDDAASNRPDAMQPTFDAHTAPYLEVKDATSIEIIITMATDYAMDYTKNFE